MSKTLPRHAIHSDRCSAPVAGYSQGFQVGSMVFVSGQLPLDPVTNTRVGDGDIVLEARQVLRNVMAVLEAAGCTGRDVASAATAPRRIDRSGTVDVMCREFLAHSKALPKRC